MNIESSNTVVHCDLHRLFSPKTDACDPFTGSTHFRNLRTNANSYALAYKFRYLKYSFFMEDKQPGLRDFQVLNKLEEGAFGKVYTVKQRADSKQYACKKITIGAIRPKQKENAQTTSKAEPSGARQRRVSLAQGRAARKTYETWGSHRE